MKTKNEKLRIALLNAGKNEFLAHGYRAVSIRNIATKAGATTGASADTKVETAKGVMRVREGKAR